MEVDHIFICSKNNASIADVFVQHGFIEGSPNRHPGQGTANRRFFFNNVFLEFIYLEEPFSPHSEISQTLDIVQRLTDLERRYSPFGFGCRPTMPGEPVPFPYRSYQPGYLPDGYSIALGIATRNEPLWFFLDFSGRPDQVAVEKRQPLIHPCGIRELTDIQLTIPEGESLSLTASAMKKIDGFEIIQGKEHQLALTFDFARQKKRLSLMPELPLTIFY